MKTEGKGEEQPKRKAKQPFLTFPRRVLRAVRMLFAPKWVRDYEKQKRSRRR